MQKRMELEQCQSMIGHYEAHYRDFCMAMARCPSATPATSDGRNARHTKHSKAPKCPTKCVAMSKGPMISSDDFGGI